MTENSNYDWEAETAERARIVGLFSSELASKLDRSEAEITKNGLSAYDFGRADTTTVEITWVDESQANFQYAFAIMSTDRSKIGVFTEHCGYFVLQASAIQTVYEDSRRTVFFNQDV